MELLLKGLKWHNGAEEISADLRIRKGVITEIGKDFSVKKGETVKAFDNHFVYPGLINAHDHLEMNLYPRLGKPYYKNYIEWGNDIYKSFESPIREIEKLDINDRLMWGGFKNLIAGATTVVHHNPWHRILGSGKFPVKVVKNIAWAHSLAFQKDILKAFPAKKIPFVIHAGEGIDETAGNEISKLDELQLLHPNTVLVHAIALNDIAIEKIKRLQSAIVWCPESNYFMFNKTCPIEKIKMDIPILLGSDSTLTGSPTLLHEIKAAHRTGMANAGEIFRMVNDKAASVFHLQSAEICVGRSADLFITPIKHVDYYENLINIHPKEICAVMVDGQIRFSNSKDSSKLKYEIQLEGSRKFIDFDLMKLAKAFAKKVDATYLSANRLWQMIRH